MAIMTTNAANVESAIRNGFKGKDVSKLPLSGPDNLRTPFYGLFTENGENVGKAVTAKYHPHTVEDIITLGTAACLAFDSEGEVQVTTYWNAGHNLTIAPSAEYRRNVFNTKDAIFPRLIISAGYDGTCFNASLGMYRDVCSNLAIMRAAGMGVSCSIKHSSKLASKLDAIRDQFESLVSQWGNVHQVANEMATRETAIAAYIESVFPRAEIETHRVRQSAQDRHAAIVSRLFRERQTIHGVIGDTNRASAWELFNAVQGYVQHDARRKGSPSLVDRAFNALDNENVARALELALAV